MSKQIRAAASKLLFALYIDVYPRSESKKPELVKIIRMDIKIPENRMSIRKSNLDVDQSFSEVRLLDTTLINFRDELETAKTNIGRAFIEIGDLEANDVLKFTDEDMMMETMLNEILEYFYSQKDNICYDMFTDEMMRISEKLVKFELYGTYCTNFAKSYTIINPLSPGFSNENIDVIRLLRSIAPLLFFTSADQRRPSFKRKNNLKRKSLNKQSDILDEDETKKNSKNYLDQLLSDPSELTEPVARSAVNLKNFISILKQSAFQDHIKKSAEDKIKVKICRILHLYLDIQLEFLINNVSGWFNHLTYSKD